MERRQSPDRRKTHLFVADDRRIGPHDRRGAEQRRLEREREREKIEAIQTYKAGGRDPSAAPRPVITRTHLIWIGLALLLIVALLLQLD